MWTVSTRCSRTLDFGHEYAGHNIRATMAANTRMAGTHHGARNICAANDAIADKPTRDSLRRIGLRTKSSRSQRSLSTSVANRALREHGVEHGHTPSYGCDYMCMAIADQRTQPHAHVTRIDVNMRNGIRVPRSAYWSEPDLSRVRATSDV